MSKAHAFELIFSWMTGHDHNDPNTCFKKKKKPPSGWSEESLVPLFTDYSIDTLMHC